MYKRQVQYAASGSKGALAGLIGWIDYGTVMNLSPGQSTTVVNTILDGYTISFDLSLTQTYSGETTLAKPISFKGFTTPVLSSGGVSFLIILFKSWKCKGFKVNKMLVE